MTVQSMSECVKGVGEETVSPGRMWSAGRGRFIVVKSTALGRQTQAQVSLHLALVGFIFLLYKMGTVVDLAVVRIK